ncbi:hypothetical protein [Tsukamurella paurometabola]|uniref:GTP pyrophosphokinase ywaC n=1 Tax=Tsukamurella paurometabola TaxID=2061 RepID=A0A3P8KL19_TSUPA|nr:hypothetical protein [Tsukamurella paurometabola]UEA84186.1 hypothetical protein LK411_04965 [Tsukamurella paurometabola]VDR41358.1 GTP pyrophosphokinase ywaC [Tsukamurella paurometabola]
MGTLEDAVAGLYLKKGTAWRTAGDTATKFLEDVVAAADPDARYGYSIVGPRFKDQERAVRKLSGRVEIAEETVLDYGSLEDGISDWVGLKVTCNTSKDARSVIEKLVEFCAREGTLSFAQKDGVDDVVDYISSPKDSGYRAFHAVLSIPSVCQGQICEVRVEVQIKTRLQDAWSELTHENFYKSVSTVEPTEFHFDLARTMADLLASVDDLAVKVAEDIVAQRIAEDRVGELRPTPDTGNDIDTDPGELVVIARVEERFAIARGEDGVRGIVPAADLRDLLARAGEVGVDDFINVADHVTVGDELFACREEREGGTCFIPTFFAIDVDGDEKN